MRLRVHELEVEQHQVAAPDHAEEILRRGEPGGAQDHVQAFQPLQHRLQEGRLHERFAAGEAHPAVGQQRRLPVQECGQLIGPVAPAGDPVAVGPVQDLGLEDQPSGLWHQAQRSGQPLRNTVVRSPGPS